MIDYSKPHALGSESRFKGLCWSKPIRNTSCGIFGSQKGSESLEEINERSYHAKKPS